MSPFMVKAFQECPDLIILFVDCWDEASGCYRSWKMNNFLDFIWKSLTNSSNETSTEWIPSMKDFLTKLSLVQREAMTLYQNPVSIQKYT